MKSIRVGDASRLGRFVFFTALLMLLGTVPRSGLAQGIDRNFRLGILRTNQTVILAWFGSNAVPYQLESSSTLTSWVDSSSVITGRGAILMVTNPIARTTRGFFRVKRLVPPGQGITAGFNPGTGALTITGDASDNVIDVSRNAAGAILVNGGAVAVQGGVPTVANTALIQIFGRDGNDTLSLNEANGALPKANLFGEAGDDTLTGGSGADVLNGGPGSDTLLGKGGADNLLGGDDNDIINGGAGDDIVQMGVGNDRFIWNPGEGTDVVEGGDGIDTVEVNGGNGAEQFTATANGTRVRFDRVAPAPFSLDIGSCENLVLNANGGDDTFSASGNLASLIQITVDGGPGNDTLLGGNGADVLIGGDGNDFIDGNQGNDTILMGAGDDTFQWDPGDGSDVVEGQAGNDTMLFNGANIAEVLDISANGGRVRFTRNIANIVMDLNDVENLSLNALGGADLLTVNDVAGTDLSGINVNLAGTIGGAAGDAAADTVIVNGTAGSDAVKVTSSTNGVVVAGLPATVKVVGSEAANDRLTINLLAGNDVVDATGLAAGSIALIADGGIDDDVLTGSAGPDVLIGGDGDDVLIGGPDFDVLDGGPGNNILIQ